MRTVYRQRAKRTLTQSHRMRIRVSIIVCALYREKCERYNLESWVQCVPCKSSTAMCIAQRNKEGTRDWRRDGITSSTRKISWGRALSVSEDVSWAEYTPKKVHEERKRKTEREREKNVTQYAMRRGSGNGKGVECHETYIRSRWGESDRKGTMLVHHNFTFHELVLLLLQQAQETASYSASGARSQRDFCSKSSWWIF